MREIVSYSESRGLMDVLYSTTYVGRKGGLDHNLL